MTETKAEVTREHRRLALLAQGYGTLYSSIPKGSAMEDWMETGRYDGNRPMGSDVIAQAIADAESRGRSSATPPPDWRGCPCTLIEPCRPSCTCGYRGLSGGCDRCASYGSKEQRLAAATRLATRLAAPPADLTAEVNRLRRSVRGVKAPCRQCGDTLAKCLEATCCVGCNHATAAPAVETKLLVSDEWLRQKIMTDRDVDTEAGLPLPLATEFQPTPMIEQSLSPESFAAAATFHAKPPEPVADAAPLPERRKWRHTAGCSIESMCGSCDQCEAWLAWMFPGKGDR